MLHIDTMHNLLAGAALGAILVQVVACGFPRPADVEPDSGPAIPLCGNSKIEPGEDCDDGNTADDGNGCDSQCHKNAICGDSKIQTLFEICDGTADCSLDCKEAGVFLFPVSDKDGRYDGTTGAWDLDLDNAMSGYVEWLAPSAGGPFEWRTAIEFETHSLHRMDLIKTTRLTIFPTGFPPQPHTLQLHGYSGDGEIAIQDMVIDNFIGSFVTEGSPPIFFDINTFVETATNQRYPFMGFLLRAGATAPTDPSWGIILSLSDNSDPNVRPRLEITYCIDSNHDNKCD